MSASLTSDDTGRAVMQLSNCQTKQLICEKEFKLNRSRSAKPKRTNLHQASRAESESDCPQARRRKSGAGSAVSRSRMVTTPGRERTEMFPSLVRLSSAAGCRGIRR